MNSKEPLLAKRFSVPPPGEAVCPPMGDKLAPAKGVVFGLAVCLPLWTILCGIAWVLRH